MEYVRGDAIANAFWRAIIALSCSIAMNQSSATVTSPDPDELLQSIRNRKLIVVTGTGFLRFASGDPLINGHQVASWTGLLGHGFEYCINVTF